jgi:hypothetical protein
VNLVCTRISCISKKQRCTNYTQIRKSLKINDWLIKV